MKSKLAKAVRILESGGQLELSTGHLLVLRENKLWYEGSQIAKETGVERPVLLSAGGWLTADDFLGLCEDLSEDMLTIKLAELVLTESKKRSTPRL